MKLIAKTLFGLETLLEQELKELGASKINVLNRAIEFESDLETLYRIAIESRVALRVLLPFANYKARGEDDFYKKAQRIDWSQYLTNDKTFAINSTTHGEQFTHSQYAGLKLKDAIVDQFREKTGARPSVNTSSPDVLINLHISNIEVSISLDATGEPLNKRGYRMETNEAPINEILAAAMIQLSGWDGITPFLDPMTGSGTIAIEAAMKARNIAPGLNRTFAFQKWSDYDPQLFEKVKAEAQAKVTTSDVEIVARDFNMGCLGIARRNAVRAGVEDMIIFDCVDFMKSDPIADSAMIIMNPPYGERLDEKIDLGQLYHDIGFRLKHSYPTHKVWVITSNLDAMKRLGLKPDTRVKLYNGSLECRFNEYTLFKGKRIDQLKNAEN
ncbi:MAG: class I SAM-dependent RNA methyltransferase [Flavobacteriales bacterium]|nr:class I SAM-dependent RNA methyltransferase [Flavobacteriales bacterium]